MFTFSAPHALSSGSREARSFGLTLVTGALCTHEQLLPVTSCSQDQPAPASPPPLAPLLTLLLLPTAPSLCSSTLSSRLRLSLGSVPEVQSKGSTGRCSLSCWDDVGKPRFYGTLLCGAPVSRPSSSPPSGFTPCVAQLCNILGYLWTALTFLYEHFCCKSREQRETFMKM